MFLSKKCSFLKNACQPFPKLIKLINDTFKIDITDECRKQEYVFGHRDTFALMTSKIYVQYTLFDLVLRWRQDVSKV